MATTTTTAPTKLKRKPIRGILYGILLGLGLALIAIGQSWAALGTWPPMILLIVGIIVGFVWSTFGPAKKPKGPAPASASPQPEPPDVPPIVTDTTDEAAEAAEDLADQATDAVDDATDRVDDFAGGAADAVEDATGDAADAVEDAAGDAADAVEDLGGEEPPRPV